MPAIRRLVLALGSMLMLVLSACSSGGSPSYPGEMRYENIVEIYCEQRNDSWAKYTIWCLDFESNEAVAKTFQHSSSNIHIFIDVPEGEMNWARHYHQDEVNYRNAMDLHVHSLDDIAGVGWPDRVSTRRANLELDPDAVVYEYGLGDH